MIIISFSAIQDYSILHNVSSPDLTVSISYSVADSPAHIDR